MTKKAKLAMNVALFLMPLVVSGLFAFGSASFWQYIDVAENPNCTVHRPNGKCADTF